ncbi:GDPD-domain-containing protein [Apiospora saccharicola]
MWTPLQLACAEGHLTIAKHLIDYGAEIDAVDDEGNTVLEMAAERGSIDIIQLLLSKWARVVDPEGRNILDSAKLVASRGGHMIAVKLLKAHAERLDQGNGDVEDIGIEERDSESYDQLEASVVDLG